MVLSRQKDYRSSKKDQNLSFIEMDTLISKDDQDGGKSKEEIEFHLAKEYLRYVNEIFEFENFKGNIFPYAEAFINTCAACLTTDIKKWNEYNDYFQCPYIRNGIILEKQFDGVVESIRQDMNTNNHYVDFDLFKEFLDQIGVMSRFVRTNNDKETMKIAIPARKETLKSCSKVQTDSWLIFIPTITNATIDDYVEKEGFKRETLLIQIRELFKNKNNGYELSYTWHASCLNTLSLINLFLVQLFKEKNWKREFSFEAQIFKEPLENRKPGVVSLIEFDGNFILVEEENVETGAFYTNRTFRIFVCDRILKQFESKRLGDLQEIVSGALQTSQDKLLNIKRPTNDKFSNYVCNECNVRLYS